MKIPRVASFYWGGKTLPFLRYLTLYSFKKFNPDWQIVLYTPAHLQEKLSWSSPEHKVPHKSKDYSILLPGLGVDVYKFDMKILGLSNELSEVHKSDFLRWHLLGTVGGMWSDMDILFFKPVESLPIRDVNTAVCFHDRVWSIGFMASSPGNLFFKDMFIASKGSFNTSKYQCVGSTLMRSLHKDLQTAEKKYPQDKLYNIPMHIVYPIDSTEIPVVYNTCDLNCIKSDTIGLHWYAGHSLSSKFVSLIDEKSFGNYNNILTSIIKKIL